MTGHTLRPHCHLYISSSQSCPQSSSSSTAWELVRNADSWASDHRNQKPPGPELQHVPQGILMVKSEPRLRKTSLSHQASSSQLLWPGLAFSPPPPLSCDPWYLTPSCSLPLAHIAHSDADHTSVIANLSIFCHMGQPLFYFLLNSFRSDTSSNMHVSLALKNL